jgi:purine-binding chemotaxis protein CheW
MTAATDYCTFWVSDHYFAVEAATVQEVIPLVPCTAVPHTTPDVDGLINLRGQIVLAMNLRQRFHLRTEPACLSPANLIVHTRDGLELAG